MLERPMSKAGWTRVAFGDVVHLSKARAAAPEAAGYERVVGLEHIDPGDLRIRRWGDIANGTTFTSVFKPGQVLFGKRRAYQRKVAVADFEGVCSGDIYVLEPANDRLKPELLPFLCQTDAFFDHAVGTSAGSLSPRTNWSSLASFEFLLPPIQEQARLVEALSAQRASIESLQAANEQFSILSAAFIAQVLSRTDDAAQGIKVADLLIDGPTNGRSPAPSDREAGFKTVSISAVRYGVFDPEGCIKFVEMATEEAVPFTVRSGDIFAIRGNGNRDLCGRVGISRETYADLVYPDLLIRMRFDQTQILPDFVVAQWNHPAVHGKLISRAKSSNGIWKVNGQDIRAHKLVVPPIEVQQEAVQFLAALGTQNSVVESRLAQLREIQKQLFKAISGDAE
ncbi:restriction endonuclease subunit S [Bradyrhizobium sp. AUGA SZCCT0182]|uniref:restriction endonuclease subunit S n=1 Tax=Bradyrhizobium sp. AUGA SZCCT0182 TaxID=2807667 RepID=UPI001BAADB38|nr:restriction endonuclease subunit S [Bradyrhizobium sp. AUGA SZCCT0182]MBR1236624.1 restriction endonuclease subunit S [Bradyrhizobium sp. AUGA SZCCT0182]